MSVYRLAVFDAAGPAPRLEWSCPGTTVPASRPIDRAEVEALVRDTETGYAGQVRDAAALGAQLYRWLDGPSDRWLAAARAAMEPVLVELAPGERLRALPWELWFEQGFLAVDPVRPVVPVRIALEREGPARVAANRPLRVLFMASSPTNTDPVLDFEGEEALILEATQGRAEVVVEESGSLQGLAETLTWHGEGWFDALHLSGHGYVGPRGPRFVAEAVDGCRSDVSAADIATAVGGVWPRLVFVSGCHTGGSVDAGMVASMAEALVDAGAPAVLGWALPVGDLAATNLAGALYQALAGGRHLHDAVTAARRALFEAKSSYWHLLRLYVDRSPVSSLVSAPGTKNRDPLRYRHTDDLFLDPEGRVKVADRAGFVGRRRDLQALLRQLRPADPSRGPQVAVIHGMGGLGKSTLTARLLERMKPTHPSAAVAVGRIDAAHIPELLTKLDLNELPVELQINTLMNTPDASLVDRLRAVLAGPLATRGSVFVFDDFEDGNLEPDGAGGWMMTPAAREVVAGFAAAIQRTQSSARVVITSRYDFPLPAGTTAVRHPILELRDADLIKKLRHTQMLGQDSPLDPQLRQRAVAAAAGVPRLLERIDQLLAADASDGDITALLAKVSNAAVEFREELLLSQLWADVPASVRRAVVNAAIYELPVPFDAMTALHPQADIAGDLRRAVQIGLLQAGPHPGSAEQRYLVSGMVRPLLANAAEAMPAEALRQVQQRGAEFLYQRWVVDLDGQ